MRKYTLLLSVTVHVTAALVLVIAPLFAAAPLPGIRELIGYVPAKIAAPPKLGDPRSTRPPSQTRASHAAAPTPFPVTPPDILPEDINTGPSSDLPPGPDVAMGPGSFRGVVGGDPIVDVITAPPPAPAPRPAPEPEPVRRVGGNLVAPKKTHHVAPVYPALALAARQTGHVILEAVISEDGTVRDVHVLRSVPLLDQAAMDAVRQWRFSPTLLGGRPVPIAMTVTVTFQLN